jgi:hypothetical protein
MATPSRTPAAAGNRRVQTPLGHTVGATRDKVPAEGHQRSVDFLAEEAVGNRGHRAHGAGAVAAEEEVGEVAAPVVGGWGSGGGFRGGGFQR